MDVEELSKIIQLYMYQNLYSDSNSDSSSTMFETMLMNAIAETAGENISSNSEANSDLQGEDVPGKVNTSSSNNRINKVLNSNLNNIDNAIKYVSDKYGVDEDLIKAVIKQESGFNPNAVSKCGAEGLMQLMPSTAKSLGVENPFNVLDNIDGGTRYLKRLMEAFDGNKELALSAYNGGIGRMNRLGVDTVQEISKMPGETKKYVSKVMQNYNNYKKL